MKRILFIEDDVEMQKIYKETFSAHEYDVVPAYTADEGLDFAKTKKPNLIILDIMLPGGKNGFDALEVLMADPETSKIPVIVLTNLDSEKKVALQIGAKDYLVKANTNIDEVVARVQKWIK